MNAARIGLIALVLALSGCPHRDITTAEDWCRHLAGEDLYSPVGLFPSIAFKAEAIRDDFARIVNEALLEKVEHRTRRMAWREGTTLHVENLSGLLVGEPERIIGEWREGIARANRLDDRTATDGPYDHCFFDSVVSLFDAVVIHSKQLDGMNRVASEHVTELDTERRRRLKNPL
jgi:hypothetical protein